MLALICGNGHLPGHIAQAQSTAPLVAVLHGFAPDGLSADMPFRLEQLGSFLAALKERGVAEVCFCGSIARPAVDPSLIDAATMPLVPRLMAAMGQGDDGALREAIRIFEDHGFAVRSAQDLAPDLVMEHGVLTQTAPTDQMREDAAKGFDVIVALSPFDTGQAAVVGAGQLLAVETLGGTDHMISTLPEVPQRTAAVLVKAPKQDQDARADWPTVGPETIRALVAAGVTGLALQPGGALVLFKDETIRLADEAGLAIWAGSATP
ncbi:MAG: UDP-2,3-diacylglucosamine diphosphatase LpxI [Rhodobacteraceae bacterium]|nr:UDP-2,3-diacylglucosamine diphosphatase LpxI [Paracoccaceae bacterium]